MIDRVIWIVLDSVGMGEMPDAKEYGDVGSNTIGNISKALGGLEIPNMENIGLGNIEGMKGLKKVKNPSGAYGRFMEMSHGKDTTTGHWEMAGVYSKDPFPTYPNGFPKEIIDAFQKKIGREIIGNKPASGTVIIEELGEEHLKSGKPIVYTSGDSVFQIAAHEDIIPLNELYKMCREARKILVGKNAVARVIARPFVGKLGSFTRTASRRDFSLDPPYDTLLDILKKNNLNVMAVGKIEDIFSKCGITEAIHTKDNMDGVDKTLQYMKENKKGLIFTNLVDFDMKWGHRNNVKAYGKGLCDFDARLPEIINSMRENDVLFINADHGCDPTVEGTDHTREYVPFLAYGKNIKPNSNLKTRKSFADIGQTIAEIFSVQNTKYGESFLNEITY